METPIYSRRRYYDAGAYHQDEQNNNKTEPPSPPQHVSTGRRFHPKLTVGSLLSTASPPVSHLSRRPSDNISHLSSRRHLEKPSHLDRRVSENVSHLGRSSLDKPSHLDRRTSENVSYLSRRPSDYIPHRNRQIADTGSSKSRRSESSDTSCIAEAAEGAATMDTTTMRARRNAALSISSAASASSSHLDLSNPFELRYGRRYLRDLPYPLPCDLSEIQRQSLRTLLGVTIFSKPSCAPEIAKNVPKKVLEIGCGSAYWTSSCHEWFESLGHPNVEFVGMDIAPLAPDLKQQGVNWKFVQHDIRRMPWPFEDGEFDFIMMKDMSLAVAMGQATQAFVDETIRVIASKGTLEIWESDHVLRCLLPGPPPPRGMTAGEEQTAQQTKTYLISPATPFAPAQNKYIADSNTWIHSALDKLNLPSTPCARVAQVLFQEPDSLTNVSARRIAVPLGQLRWEKDPEGKLVRSGSSSNILGTPPKGKSKTGGDTLLTEDQEALRYTALLTVVQKIESLEPLLKDASGKNAEEWTRWWSSMMTSLLDQESGGSSGEVLEVGAWWATKI